MKKWKIKYRGGYKYQLAEDYEIFVGVLNRIIKADYLSLNEQGILKISKGYAWDGPSGIAIDTPNFMRASLVHDALYQLIRLQLIEKEYRELADNIMHKVCLEAGMSKLRAWWCWKAVRKVAAFAADPRNKKLIQYAP